MELLLALLLNNIAPGAIPAKQLAPVILEVANKYALDPVLIARIIVIESRGLEKAENKLTHDFGLMQINEHTAQAMHLSRKCLLDWKCNINAGARILSHFKRPCRYNVGTASLIGTKLKNCLRYERKLATVN